MREKPWGRGCIFLFGQVFGPNLADLQLTGPCWPPIWHVLVLVNIFLVSSQQQCVGYWWLLGKCYDLSGSIFKISVASYIQQSCLVVSAIQSDKIIIIGWYCVVTILCLYVVGSQWTRKYRRVKGGFELLKNIMFIYATVKH